MNPLVIEPWQSLIPLVTMAFGCLCGYIVGRVDGKAAAEDNRAQAVSPAQQGIQGEQ